MTARQATEEAPRVGPAPRSRLSAWAVRRCCVMTALSHLCDPAIDLGVTIRYNGGN